jgi:hypothetical protein
MAARRIVQVPTRCLWWRESHPKACEHISAGSLRETATESRLTFLTRRAKLAIVFALLNALVGAMLAALKPRASLVAENLALRPQWKRSCFPAGFRPRVARPR